MPRVGTPGGLIVAAFASVRAAGHEQRAARAGAVDHVDVEVLVIVHLAVTDASRGV